MPCVLHSLKSLKPLRSNDIVILFFDEEKYVYFIEGSRDEWHWNSLGDAFYPFKKSFRWCIYSKSNNLWCSDSAFGRWTRVDSTRLYMGANAGYTLDPAMCNCTRLSWKPHHVSAVRICWWSSLEEEEANLEWGAQESILLFLLLFPAVLFFLFPPSAA